MNKKIALDNLLELSQILESENVKWWLTDGTLLGLFRESDFISHDHDTDIGVDHKTFTKTSFSKIIKSGFKVEHIFGLWAESFEICFSKNGVKTDLFFFYQKDDLYYHSAFDNFNSIGYTRYDYNYQYFDTKWTNFLGHQFKIPKEPLNFIETKYGKEWKTPIKKWHWSTSPKNSINTGIFIEQKNSKLLFDKWLKS
jgi:hypothetical protein